MTPPLKFVITGHPRSGTGYAAALCRANGLDVGHERLRPDGISSWMWAAGRVDVPWGDPPGAEGPGWQDAHCVYLVREPVELVASVAFTERASEAWRMEVLGRYRLDYNAVELAVLSIHGWHAMGQEMGFAPVALPSFALWLQERLGRPLAGGTLGRVNARKHPPLDASEVAAALRTADVRRAWDDIRAIYKDLQQ